MAINTLADWTANGALSRQSILGRPRRKDGRELPGEDGDEVQRSRTTDHHIQTFFDALEGGDESGQSHALNKVVQSWRADNNAGGLPVFAHLPLPVVFANTLAKMMPSPDGKQGIAAKLEPGARVSVFQQLREAASNSKGPLARAGSFRKDAYLPAPLQLAQTDLRPAFPLNGNSPSYPRQLPPPSPSRIPNRNGFDPLERAPTWAPEQSPQERGAPRPVSPPPPIVERQWQQELAARARSGERHNALEEWGETLWSYLGYPISPEEQLRRQKARELEGQGTRPIHFGPRDPLPDDPYKDRVAWPVRPHPGEADVVVTSPWGPRVLKSGSREFHPGTDFRNKRGRPAFSPMNGTILRIEQSATGGGNQIFILNDDGSIVGFAHTGSLEGLQEGDEVYAGQLIGISDGTGGAPGKPPEPHAHLSYYPPGTPVDPRTKKPLQGPSPHDVRVTARTQAKPEDGLKLSRPPRRLNQEGYTGRTPMHVKP